MPPFGSLFLVFALAAPAFATITSYTDFDAAVATFNSDVNSWNSGPLGLVAFNNDIANFNTAVDTFNAATSGSYATVSPVSPYGTISPYAGSTSAINAFNSAASAFNVDVGNFDAGSLDRPNFASDVATFNNAVITFNIAGASPPAGMEPSPPTYSQEDTVTDPSPEPSSALLTTLGLGLAGACLAKKRRAASRG